MPIKLKLLILFISVFTFAQAQQPSKSSLTIDQIMQGSAFIGTSPSNVYWSENGKQLYFFWNPENARRDSLYVVNANGNQVKKVSLTEQRSLPGFNGRYNKNKSKKVYEKNGDIFLLEIKSNKVTQITNTVEREYLPAFGFDENKIGFLQTGNLFLWQSTTGQISQVTNFKKGKKMPDADEPKTEQEKWLRKQQTGLLEVVKQREQDKLITKTENNKLKSTWGKEIYTGDKTVDNIVLSPDERFVTYRLVTTAVTAKPTGVPSYVSASGFTENIPTRTKVGAPLATYEFGLYDRKLDTTFIVSFNSVPGITEVPAFRNDYPASKADVKTTVKNREVIPYGPIWSDNGKNAILVIRSADNKDRWIMGFEPTTRQLKLISRQHDEAWIGGPGIGYDASSVGWMPDNENVWFQSEESGYSHLYVVNKNIGAKKTLTQGKFEVSNLAMSRDKKYWYFNANKNHPGDVQFYRMPVTGGEMVQITSLSGSHEVTMSPDEKTLAVRYSSSNKPWELYLMENKKGAPLKPLTNSLRPEFKNYKWREPEVISFKATDGVDVYARVYRPQTAQQNGPAVIFVHGAGYLQNAHKWWSQYFREYMFHNFLADNGYTVLDIDYRGSAGYGRDVRTGIYRHMGGKDLSDHVDGAKLLVQKYGVDPKRIGIYGGSYGGFITLMAMFTHPDVFAAGGALRSVTDWAHYNHGYTANILNEPFTDSLAYVKSSPIYFADGLKGALLMCHGMVDTNVHFQDIVRLSQKLIELRKENWELAVYPVEDHGFIEPSSWADEYKRIYKLFETNLKKGL